ncbi:MAG: CopG family transcriptional regulator [Gammaproteobacteria bacterium]|nr:CopG family transcriptional regulator [Gammaproteobacteria bacterium]
MTTAIPLTDEAEQRIDFLVSQTGRSKAYYLREIVERGLEDLEDYYLAAEALQRARSGKERVYSMNEARRNLCLDRSV